MNKEEITRKDELTLRQERRVCVSAETHLPTLIHTSFHICNSVSPWMSISYTLTPKPPKRGFLLLAKEVINFKQNKKKEFLCDIV